jgi:hypothetical protein
MTKASGYILNVVGRRRQELLSAQEFGETPSEGVLEFSHSYNVPLVGFVGFTNGAITHLADARPGQRAGTLRRRLILREMTELPKPVLHSDILKHVSARVRKRVSERLSDGGLLSPASFLEVVEAVRNLSSASRPILDRFSAGRERRIEGLRPAAKNALSYQKETVATALALAGIDRRPLQEWEPPPSPGGDRPTPSPESFLQGLPSAYLREDQMIMNDMMQVPGFDLVRPMQHGAALFKNDETRVTVVIGNRTALETQLGADLIYYNVTYRSFVIIQYKAMEEAKPSPLFRLPDSDLASEVARMKVALQMLQQSPPNTDRLGFRIMENPFFLKLCPRLVFNPGDTSLIRGMYLPLDYWHLIEADHTLIGPKGGKQVTFENVGRYFDNTGFIALMTKAWIGTTPPQSSLLRPIIEAALQTNRAVTIAVKTDTRVPTKDETYALTGPEE